MSYLFSYYGLRIINECLEKCCGFFSIVFDNAINAGCPGLMEYVLIGCTTYKVAPSRWMVQLGQNYC